MSFFECCDCFFYRNFESANCDKVELVKCSPYKDDLEFNVWVKADCAGTEYEKTNKSWFYFGLKSLQPSRKIKINVIDLSRQIKLYSNGMKPVYLTVPGQTEWLKIPGPVIISDKKNFSISFTIFSSENPKAKMFIAFTYPYTYTNLQNDLNEISVNMMNNNNRIYFMKETVCYTVGNRIIDLLTISSYENQTEEREDRLLNLFPNKNQLRPFKYESSKKVIFLTARVHPGEVPSSFVMKGIIQLLINDLNPLAKLLRNLYVFKIIPMLNPDGVASGYFRSDTLGQNLNRFYHKPNFELQPAIYAVVNLIKYYNYGYNDTEIFLYADLHAHCSKRGIFCYGNHFNNIEDAVDCHTFARLLSLNSPFFRMHSSCFTLHNMFIKGKKDGLSRENTGRVQISKQTGLTRSYTIEINYHGSEEANIIAPMTKKLSKFEYNYGINTNVSFTPKIYEEFSFAFAMAILDATSSNPYTRLPNTIYPNLENLKASMKSYLLNRNGYWYKDMMRIQNSQNQSNQSSDQHESNTQRQSEVDYYRKHFNTNNPNWKKDVTKSYLITPVEASNSSEAKIKNLRNLE